MIDYIWDEHKYSALLSMVCWWKKHQKKKNRMKDRRSTRRDQTGIENICLTFLHIIDICLLLFSSLTVFFIRWFYFCFSFFSSWFLLLLTWLASAKRNIEYKRKWKMVHIKKIQMQNNVILLNNIERLGPLPRGQSTG